MGMEQVREGVRKDREKGVAWAMRAKDPRSKTCYTFLNNQEALHPSGGRCKKSNCPFVPCIANKNNAIYARI